MNSNGGVNDDDNEGKFVNSNASMNDDGEDDEVVTENQNNEYVRVIVAVSISANDADANNPDELNIIMTTKTVLIVCIE